MTTTASAETFAEAAQRGTGSALLFALTAGLLTALTPCVYPMIPITMSVFGARQGTSRARALLLAALYVAGIAIMFGSLGTIFALLGKAFGTLLASPWLVFPLAALFIAMSLSMFGAFEIALPSAWQQRLTIVGGSGPGGAFAMGLVGGLIAAPCTGPPLAGMLAYVATTRDALSGFFLLATYAAGMGLPFFAIAGFALQLPKSGPWLESVKSVFGIVLLVAALYYLKNAVPWLAKLTSPSRDFLFAAMAVILVGLGLGAVHLTFHDAPGRRFRKGMGVLLSVAGLFAVTNYLLTPKATLAWLHAEEDAIAQARSGGKPLVVDFMADWCLPCKELEVHVFSHERVVRRLRDFVLLKVDLTREDDDGRLLELKQKYGVETLPAVRIVRPDGRIVGETNAVPSIEDFLALLARVDS